MNKYLKLLFYFIGAVTVFTSFYLIDNYIMKEYYMRPIKSELALNYLTYSMLYKSAIIFVLIYIIVLLLIDRKRLVNHEEIRARKVAKLQKKLDDLKNTEVKKD